MCQYEGEMHPILVAAPHNITKSLLWHSLKRYSSKSQEKKALFPLDITFNKVSPNCNQIESAVQMKSRNHTTCTYGSEHMFHPFLLVTYFLYLIWPTFHSSQVHHSGHGSLKQQSGNLMQS
jgi:hypothetical protein